MDRRDFFKRSASKAADTVVQGSEAYVRSRAAHWIRAPYALDELEFLMSCTRCGECVDACPHQVIFPLPARLGVQVVGTPALDLTNKGCHLCTDWRCVAVCEPGALERPVNARGESELPRMAAASVNTLTCLPYLGPECGACADSCPVSGAMIWHRGRPRIDPEKCTGCALCREACIVNPKAIKVESLYGRHGQSATTGTSSACSRER